MIRTFGKKEYEGVAMATTTKPHKKLTLWQKVIDLVSRIYQLTKDFPREEEFGLKSQMRRAAVSIPSNIAEGLSRTSIKEKLNFLGVARGSLSELDAQIEVCGRLGLLKKRECEDLVDAMEESGRLLGGLIRKLRKDLSS